MTSFITGAENEVIARLAQEAAAREAIPLTEHRVGYVVPPGSVLEIVDLSSYRPAPDRKTGNVTVTDADSFVNYVGRHQTAAGTTLWADLDAAAIVAVIDDHEVNGGPAWGQHRASLRMRPTDDWHHWVKRDGQLVDQDTFAEHIEDGADAIRDPSAATMLEVAQSFHARNGAAFDSTRRLSGEIQFTYREEVTAKAGQSGTLEVPETFTLGLAPFEGTEPYAVTARLRFRLTNGNLTIGYRLTRPERVRRAAFNDIAASVDAGTGLRVMSGSPRAV